MTGPAPIRVVLADDEALIRGAVAALLGLEPDIEIVGEAGDGSAAVELVAAHRPDVAVVDLQMPGMTGLEVAAEAATVHPSCAVVILTGHSRPALLRRALQSGARGFVPKGSPASVLADVIRRVHGGGRYVDPALAAEALLAPECPLTPRELDVLRLAGTDVPVATIARQAHLTTGTVRNYLAAAVAKLEVTTRAEARVDGPRARLALGLLGAV